MALKFVRNASFPATKCLLLESGYFWKMLVREWAFAQLDLQGVSGGIDITSNNPNVVRGVYDKTEQGLKTSSPGAGMLTAKFYGKASGFTFVHPFKSDQFVAEEDLRMQVEVVKREAKSQDQISLTELQGSTVAINAPDARSYEMTSTGSFSSSAGITALFSSVPAGADHVVIGSHGGFQGTSNSTSDLCMFVAGKSHPAALNLTNVEAVFATLKGKVAPTCVVWLGGCIIGANDDFCEKASVASGCAVVAPTNLLPAKKYPKGTVDVIDRFAGTKVFIDKSKVWVGDFCARQEKHKFVVPV